MEQLVRIIDEKTARKYLNVEDVIKCVEKT